MPATYKCLLILPFLLSQVLSAPVALPGTPLEVVSPSKTDAWGTAATAYKCFKGTSFPSEFLPFDELLSINKPQLSQGNSPQDVQNIINAINTVSAEVSPSVSPYAYPFWLEIDTSDDFKLTDTGANHARIGGPT